MPCTRPPSRCSPGTSGGATPRRPRRRAGRSATSTRPRRPSRRPRRRVDADRPRRYLGDVPRDHKTAAHGRSDQRATGLPGREREIRRRWRRRSPRDQPTSASRPRELRTSLGVTHPAIGRAFPSTGPAASTSGRSCSPTGSSRSPAHPGPLDSRPDPLRRMPSHEPVQHQAAESRVVASTPTSATSSATSPRTSARSSASTASCSGSRDAAQPSQPRDLTPRQRRILEEIVGPKTLNPTHGQRPCRCGRRDSNPHGLSPPAPKAGVSTNFATPAARPILGMRWAALDCPHRAAGDCMVRNMAPVRNLRRATRSSIRTGTRRSSKADQAHRRADPAGLGRADADRDHRRLEQARRG